MTTMTTSLWIVTETEDAFDETMTDVVVDLYYEEGEADGSCGPLVEVMSVKNAKTGEEYDESRYDARTLDRKICNFITGMNIYSF